MSIHPVKSNLNNQRGFTLVETLVALVVLTMALVPLLQLSSSATKSSETIRDNLIAAGLAQEGAEVVHAIRDTNWFNGREFDFGLIDGTYQTEWDSTTLLSLGGNPVLNLNNGLYTYSGGTATKFRRNITITKINAGELKVASIVTWQSQTQASRSITAEDHLFNWK
jgi:prepilin-type N-terminal cleavage/methylation domain-containing protein